VARSAQRRQCDAQAPRAQADACDAGEIAKSQARRSDATSRSTTRAAIQATAHPHRTRSSETTRPSSTDVVMTTGPPLALAAPGTAQLERAAEEGEDDA
jgi:hypothetical protein